VSDTAAVVTDHGADRWAVTRETDGWRVRSGFDLPDEPFDLTDRRWCCAGDVDDDQQATAAVVAAARGTTIVAACRDARRRTALVDDLARVGEVTVELHGEDPLHDLDDDQRGLLVRLAAGDSIPTAAAALFLSTRTAERRVASARRVLGVRTTTEAVALVARHRVYTSP
jgi:DNA-binding NarL/FixJ family response regulator